MTVIGRAIIAGVAIAVFLVWAARAETNHENWWHTQAVRACCSDADAVYADEWSIQPDGSIRARVTGGGPRNHAWAPIGREFIIPADKILREPGNPTGKPLLFLRSNDLYLYCFAMGAGI